MILTPSTANYDANTIRTIYIKREKNLMILDQIDFYLHTFQYGTTFNSNIINIITSHF